MNYNFDIEIAEKLGVNAAIVINNLQFWIKKNEANNKHFHEGRTWTYNSNKAMKELFPFWTERQIRKIIDDLVNNDIIIKGNFSETKYDRTLWYAFTDFGNSICQKCQLDLSNLSNESDRNVKPITDKNTDIKPDKNTDREEPPKTNEITEIVYDENKATNKKIDYQKIVDEFNQVAQRLPRVMSVTDKRKREIKKRLEEHGVKALSVCFFKASQSTFLAGENDRGWIASFDWIMDAKNFVKVLEGNYDKALVIPKNLQGALNNLTNQMSRSEDGDIFGL